MARTGRTRTNRPGQGQRSGLVSLLLLPRLPVRPPPAVLSPAARRLDWPGSLVPRRGRADVLVPYLLSPNAPLAKLYLEHQQASITFERMTVGEAITEWERFQPEGTYAARADMQGLKEVADPPDDRAREREPDKECPMKRSTFDGEAIVYRYGCPHWADLDEAGLGQLRLAHNLWNELVAGELQHEETVRQLWAQ